MFKRVIGFTTARKKDIIAKTQTLHEGIVHIRKKGKVHIKSF